MTVPLKYILPTSWTGFPSLCFLSLISLQGAPAPCPFPVFGSSPKASHQGQSLLQPQGQCHQTLACHSHSLCGPLSPFLLSSTEEPWSYLDLSASSRLMVWGCLFFIIHSSVTAFGPCCPEQRQEHRPFLGKCVGWNIWALPISGSSFQTGNSPTPI